MRQEFLEAMELADFLDPIINKKVLHIIESNGSGAFVKSDNPVTLLIPRELALADRWGFENSSVLVPISPGRAILLKNRPAASEILRVDHFAIGSLNRAIESFAVRDVYSHILSPDIRDMFDNTAIPVIRPLVSHGRETATPSAEN